MKRKQQLAQLAEWRTASLDGLRQKLDDLNRDLQSFRLQKATGQLGQNHLLGVTRSDIARLKTVINARMRQSSDATSAKA